MLDKWSWHFKLTLNLHLPKKYHFLRLQNSLSTWKNENYIHINFLIHSVILATSKGPRKACEWKNVGYFDELN